MLSAFDFFGLRYRTAVQAYAVLSFTALLLALAGIEARAADPISAQDLPPALRAVPMEALLGAFSVPHEPPAIAAEIARLDAWTPPGDDLQACPALAQVMAKYPGTADARRALFDLARVYASRGDWQAAEAPFRYVMEAFAGRAEGRIARLRLIEFYRHTDPPLASQGITECRAAIAEFVGTPEEGLGRMLSAELLSYQGKYPEAFAEYDRVMEKFSAQPYAGYACMRYALTLCEAGQAERAKQVVEPFLEDPVWSGRVHYARGCANSNLSLTDAAVADYERAARTADSLWFRSEAHRELARLLAERGEVSRATSQLRECLAVYPLRKDNLELRLNIVRNLYASKQHLAAAQEALTLKLDALNSPQRYLPEEISMISGACSEILDKCEAALYEADSKPGR